jgi:hypothetical protein
VGAAAKTIAERAARNQSTFRDANERIRDMADRVEAEDAAPFICECPRRECTSVTNLRLEEYEMVRERGNRFLVVPGHEITVVDGVEIARVASTHDRFTVMEKVGEAAVVAEQLDTRTAERRSHG